MVKPICGLPFKRMPPNIRLRLVLTSSPPPLRSPPHRHAANPRSSPPLRPLYEIEADIRGLPPELRRRARQERAKPLVDALKPWLEESLAKVPRGGKIAEALAYGLNHWAGLGRFLDDGRIEIDSNTVERSIRGLALSRKNALFAGNDRGAEGWAMLASLLETCKLNAVDPLAWTTDVLTKLVNRWPASRIDDLMPWAYAKKPA